VQRVVLDPQLSQAELGGQPVGPDERREPGTEIDRTAGRRRQQIGIPPDRVRPGGDRLPRHRCRDPLVVVRDLERPEAPVARVSVCLPARDEASTIGAIVAAVRHQLVEDTPLVDEILVLDDGSIDATSAASADAGARVRAVADILPELGPSRGKGEAMWKAVY